jgi:hypothetical protein
MDTVPQSSDSVIFKKRLNISYLCMIWKKKLAYPLLTFTFPNNPDVIGILEYKLNSISN